MTFTTKEAEGKYYWTANLKPYLGRDQLHQSKGLAEIYWSGNEYKVNVILVLTSAASPDKPLAGIAFEGNLETGELEKIREGDTLHLRYLKRIGVEYSQSGTHAGPYKYSVERVDFIDQNGTIEGFTVKLDTDRTKATIRFDRVVENR
ncbi:MAG: hypothetical protein C4B58_04850 [Deltaproteobacteria bacterium]|nr:MAG: hypothetical protein C4B58_04850 [Deltaproteobacteria bacterium]